MNDTDNVTDEPYDDYHNDNYEKDLEWHKVIVNIVFFIIGFIGNICLIYISLRHKSMRSVPNYLISNLAFVDLVFICMLMPRHVYFGLKSSTSKYEFYKTEASCSIYNYLKIVFLGVSVFTLTGLSIDRYLAVSKAMAFRESRSGRRRLCVVLFGILIIWVLALALAVPEYFNATLWGNGYCTTGAHKPFYVAYTFMAVVILLVLPTAIISVSYCCTARNLIKSNNLVPGQNAVQVSSRQHRQRLRLAIAIIVIVFVFFTTWGLHYSLEVSVIIDWEVMTTPAWKHILFVKYVLIRVNAVINPIILFVVSSAHRRHFKTSFCWCLPGHKKDEHNRGRRFNKNMSITMNTSVDSKFRKTHTDNNRLIVVDHQV